MDPLLDVRPPPVLPVVRPVAERAAPDVAALVEDLRQLPAQRPALLRVVQLADDEGCSVRALAEVAALDPAYAARLLQLANSAYYGRRGQVSAIAPAVAVLGAETLRGLAVAMALGLAGEHGALPSGFWDRAATTAAASRLLAPRVAADPGDAFCVGLLHEVGQALLLRAAPDTYPVLLALGEPEQSAAEREWCGTTSAQVGAAALSATGLPDVLCDAIAQQRQAATAPLPRALRGGVLLAVAVGTGAVDEATCAGIGDVVGPGLAAGPLGELALRAAAQAAALRASMG